MTRPEDFGSTKNGWDLTAGEGYIAKIGAAEGGGTALAFLVPGAHDTTTVIEFLGGEDPSSKSGTNYFAPPYHLVPGNARELFLEIGGEVQFLTQHRKIDDTFEVYTFGGGTIPPNGWNLVPGEGYIVKIGSDKDFVPAHY